MPYQREDTGGGLLACYNLNAGWNREVVYTNETICAQAYFDPLVSQFETSPEARGSAEDTGSGLRAVFTGGGSLRDQVSYYTTLYGLLALLSVASQIPGGGPDLEVDVETTVTILAVTVSDLAVDILTVVSIMVIESGEYEVDILTRCDVQVILQDGVSMECETGDGVVPSGGLQNYAK